MQETIGELEQDKKNKVRTIQDLMEQNMRLNRTLYSPKSPPNSYRPGNERLQNQYCLTHDCYTPTEFALFGVGICIAGKIIFKIYDVKTEKISRFLFYFQVFWQVSSSWPMYAINAFPKTNYTNTH